MERKKIIKTRQAGVTLVELLMAVFLFVVIIASVAVFFDFFFDSYYFAYDENRNIDQAKFSVDILSSEVREAKISEEGAYPIITAGDQEFAFYSDADNDGDVEQLRYFLDGSVLKRGIIEPSAPPNMYDPGTEEVSIVSDYVQNGATPVFYYYNGGWPGDVVNNPLQLTYRLLETRMVGVELFVNTSPGSSEDLVIGTKALIRNLKSNY
ncbi:PilW family protein [Pseudomonadota bacterium]